MKTSKTLRMLENVTNPSVNTLDSVLPQCTHGESLRALLTTQEKLTNGLKSRSGSEKDRGVINEPRVTFSHNGKC